MITDFQFREIYRCRKVIEEYESLKKDVMRRSIEVSFYEGDKMVYRWELGELVRNTLDVYSQDMREKIVEVLTYEYNKAKAYLGSIKVEG